MRDKKGVSIAVTGDAIRLRPIVMQDLKYLNLWKNNEEIYKYLGGGFQPVSIDQHRLWIESLIDMSGVNRRFIIEKFDGEPIGMVGLYDIQWVHRICEIGIFIGEQEARGKGYASDACRVIERYAYEHLNLRKIKLKVVADNDAGLAFWTKSGYAIVGKYIQERYIKGEYRDLILMEKFLTIDL